MNESCRAFLAARDFLLRHRADHATAVRDFRWPTLSTFNWALDYFDAIARDNDDPALQIVVEDGPAEVHTFRDLSARSNRVANHLRSLGVRRGDRILLMLGNEVALWEVMLASMKLGAVVIPATTLMTRSDLDDRIGRGRVRHVVAGAAHVDRFDGIDGDFTRIAVPRSSGDGTAASPPAGWHDYAGCLQAPDVFVPDGATQATDPLLLYFTSGTTARPKMVLHSHQSYPVGHLSTLYWIGLQKGDVHLNISSPGWAKHAWSCFFAPWNAGACVFIHVTARFSATALLRVLERHRVTSLCAPPTVWRMLIQEDLAAWRSRIALRELVGAGEPLNPEIIDRVRDAWGLTLRDGYGQTETTAQIGNPPGLPLKPGSMGKPLPGHRIALLDPDGRPATEGELALVLDPAPTGLMLGYADDAAQTANVMRDGHYRTGDTASMDDDGYITFVGRADDVFKASDYRISPFELESALIEHPAIVEVAIVPSPDPVRLAVPKACVILRDDRSPDAALAREIFRFARERLAPYKRVRRLEFVTALPKTLSGKIRRVELRRDEAARRSSDGRAPNEFFDDDFPELKSGH